jgi:RHS repeat-associated protein
MLQQSGGVPTNRLTGLTTSGVTANYTYDSAGNVTNDGSHTYAYDASNQRYKKVMGGAMTHYIWRASQVIAEHNGSTGAVVTDCVYSGSRMIANVSGGSTQYFLSDRLSMRMTLDTGGNVLGRQAHLPFGEDFAETGTQEKHHFTSYERDSESGTDYALNRQYAEGIGRFGQVDPKRCGRNGDFPQDWHRYVYVRNDPADLVDPKGLYAIDVLPGWVCILYPLLCGRDEIRMPHPRQDPERTLDIGTLLGFAKSYARRNQPNCTVNCIRIGTLVPLYACDGGFWSNCYCDDGDGFFIIPECGISIFSCRPKCIRFMRFILT